MKKWVVVVSALYAAFVLLGAFASGFGTTQESAPAAETNANAGETQPPPSDTKAKPDKRKPGHAPRRTLGEV